MKSGLTLMEMATELQRQSESKKDYIADTRALKMKPDDKAGVVLDGVNGGMALRLIAHQQMSATLGIPKAYYDKMLTDAPDLLSANVNKWLERQPARKLVRTLDNSIRAILSDSYRPLDNLDLAEAVLPKLTSLGCRVESSQITDSRFYLKVVTDRIKGDVKVGDTVQAGLVVSNSEVGLGRLLISALDFRLVCLNGMIREEGIKKTHLGRSNKGGDALEDAREFFRDETRLADDRAFFLKTQDAVASMFDEGKFMRRIEQYKEAGAQKIEADPVKVVEVVAKRLECSDGERASILKHLIQGGDLSVWGLGNAVTRASQDIEDYDRATQLERLGGQVIEMPKADWKTLAV